MYKGENKMKTKKIFSILLAFITTICFFSVGAFALDDEESQEIPNKPEGTPEFIFEGTDTFYMDAGETDSLDIKIKNISQAACWVMNASVLQDGNNFSFPDSNTLEKHSLCYNCPNYLSYKVKVSDSTPAGKYPMTLYMKIRNYDRVISEQNLTFYIIVNSSVDVNGLTVTDYSINLPEIDKGDKFTITAKVKNNTGAAISNAKFELLNLDGKTFAMDSGLATKTLSFEKNEEKDITYDVIACGELTSIREVINLKISYALNPANHDTATETITNITIPCKKNASNDPNTKVFAPNIIISDYNFGGDYVTGGKTFLLNVSIKNTSMDASIQNLKVTVNGVSGGKDSIVAFSPANSSNSFFFDSLAAGATASISIDMLPKSDAKPDSYPLNICFEYEYSSNGTKEKADDVTETITIPLQQEDRFSIGEPEVYEAYVGQDLPISTTLVNKGKSAVYNVSVDIEGEGFTNNQTSYYIGNVESGSEEYYDTTIIPDMAGNLNGTIVVTYEDANGNEKQLRKEFSATVYDMGEKFNETMMGNDFPVDGDMPMDGGMNQGAVTPWFVYAIIIVILAGGVTITIILIKKNKKKKALLAEKEDDNEDI